MLCPLCKTEQTEVKNIKSDNFGWVCENENCQLRVNLFNVKTWIRKPTEKMVPPEPVIERKKVYKGKYE